MRRYHACILGPHVPPGLMLHPPPGLCCMLNAQSDARWGWPGTFYACYGGVRQWDPDDPIFISIPVGVLGQRIEILHAPVGPVYALAIDR